VERNNCGWRIVALGVGLGFAAAHAAEKGPAAPSAEEIARWVRQLDDDSFPVRESASKGLLRAGKAAIRALTVAAAGDSLEVTERALRILGELGSSPEGETARVARAALKDLAGSRHPAASDRARRALHAYREKIAAEMERCGARVTVCDDGTTAVNFDSATALGENLRLLHELPDVTYLSFSTPLMDDDGLARLKDLPRLRELNLYRSRVGDGGLKYLKTLPGLRRVPMGETRVTDAGLVHLKDLTHLEYVGLRGNRVTDAGLVHLKDLTNLNGLYLGETKVTDAGLLHLRRLTKLTFLPLDHTRVSNSGLEHLQGLTALEYLNLSATRVTEAGVARLRMALPQAQIRMKDQ
jgi:hypothetical protein